MGRYRWDLISRGVFMIKTFKEVRILFGVEDFGEGVCGFNEEFLRAAEER